MVTCIRCLIYTRISKDKLGDGHGVANQLADLEKRAEARGWTVGYRLSDNDIGVTRKDPTVAGKRRPGYEEALRLVDAGAVDVPRMSKATREQLAAWGRLLVRAGAAAIRDNRADEAGDAPPRRRGVLDSRLRASHWCQARATSTQ
jgi:hypothetical protein